ncbi:MAG: hemin receptor [Prevotella sp.]|nr:hemin receptor [Prevotella sp.]
MMKKYFALAALAMAIVPAAAQDTYENARVLGNDLNGTARYVGMGGALEALGADISTISTNPAGIGLFRHSTASLSFGAVSQQDVTKFDNLSKTNLSFDQVGFVWANQVDDATYVNFGFNYHKSRNFDQILQASSQFNRHNGQGASLGKLAFAKSTKHSDTNGGYDLGYNTNTKTWMGYRNPQENNDYGYPFTQWDYLYTNAYNMDDVNDPQGANIFSEANDYYFDKAHRGWIADYDFNLSGNVNDRVFWGLTIGIHSVNYKGYSLYDEMLVNANDQEIGNVMLEDERKIEGNGADVKAGLIFRPFEESPFRIGVSIATPTWYKLKSSNYTTIYNRTYTGEYYEKLLPDNLDFWGYDDLRSEDSYEYKYNTPWKFGLSLGHTIDNMLALGASYEYCDYGSASTRIYNGSFDYYGEEETNEDRAMNNHTGNTLKGVSLLKLGAELRPDPSFAVRLGYNYQSAAYQENGYRDTQLDSPGTYFSSTADYVNWKDTHRITCGAGYRYNNLSLDLAYQYSTTNGTFYPFQPNVEFEDGVHETCISTPSDVSFKRHQLLFTIGYTF